ncbi:hypothetical protein [Streptomyces sp. NPDC004721]
MITSPTVSALRTPRGPVTVRYDACAAMTVRPDGARALTGHDSFSITVEPTLYQGVTPERIAAIDAAVPAAAHVPMPPRDPDQIPQPWEREATTVKRPRVQGRQVAVWLAVVWGLIALTATVQELQAPDTSAGFIRGMWLSEFLPIRLTSRVRRWARQRN